MRIYTRKGDDGTTGLLYGGRVRKDSARIALNGAVDEAQAFLGLARSEAVANSGRSSGSAGELEEMLVELEHALWVLMAEVATASENRSKLVPGTSLVTEEMVTSLEHGIDGLADRYRMPTEFVIPGANRRSAALDVARTVVRRAERLAVTDPPAPGSLVGRYLNRLSDLLWAMARWQEGDEHLGARDVTPGITTEEPG